MNDEILAYTKLLLVKVTLGVYLVRPVVSSPTKKKKKKTNAQFISPPELERFRPGSYPKTAFTESIQSNVPLSQLLSEIRYFVEQTPVRIHS